VAIAGFRVRRKSLAAQILAAQAAIVVLISAIGFGLVAFYQHNQLDGEYERRALAVAETVAASSALQQAVEEGDPGGIVQKMASQIMRATHVRYVVVTNAAGIRYSHPNPALIGKPVYDDPEPWSSEPFRTGKPWIGIQKGTLGLTARGKVPLFDAAGRLIGEVSVGIPVAQVSDYFDDELPSLAAWTAAVLGLGAVLAFLLSRRLKRQTRGLELHEITSLLEEREALLHGIREGLVGLDNSGRIRFANDQAERMLSLPPDSAGRNVADLKLPPRVKEVLTGEASGSDQVLVVGGLVLVANRMPVRIDHRSHAGWVVTFQDRTESESLLRELDTVSGFSEALRAQSHEFSNRLHTLVGLVQMGRYDEAISYVCDLSAARNELVDTLLSTVDNSNVAALLLGKSSVAAERGVEFRVEAPRRISFLPGVVSEVLCVLGNLIDNAIDAALACRLERGGKSWVHVGLDVTDKGLQIEVADSGPGVPPELRQAIFQDGFSTKPAKNGSRRGLGLAMVREICSRHQGSIEVAGEAGAVFRVVLPGAAIVIPIETYA